MRHSPAPHPPMATRRSPATRPAAAAVPSARPRKASPRKADPPERAEPRASLPALIARFTDTLTDPVEAAIAPHAIHALSEFAKIRRRPTRTVTFAWIDLDALLAATPLEDDPGGAGPGLAAAYFSVLAAFYRWRAAEGALEESTADRLSTRLLGFSKAMRELERGAGSGRPPS